MTFFFLFLKYYEKDWRLFPGKRGINLSLEQYKLLFEIISDGSLDHQIEGMLEE